MSTARQIAAYREIKQTRLEENQRKAYGMVPIKARHPQACGCGRVYNISDGYGRDGVACSMRVGDRIVKFEGKWMNVNCVENIKQDRFRATCRFVLEERTPKGWRATGWTDDPKQAQTWRELCAMIDNPELGERVVDRG
jgi:hypothetical protein